MSRDPETDAEWQEAVDAAHVWLLVDAARQYGLVRGGPGVNIERCREILRAGRSRGVFPHPKAVERFFHQEDTEQPYSPAGLCPRPKSECTCSLRHHA